jgi:hypothetical protein
MKPREILNQLIVPTRTAEDCKLCEGESTNGVYYIWRVTDDVSSNQLKTINQSTKSVKYRAERGQAMTEKDGNGPAY